MEKKELAYKDWQDGVKYKDIATKHEVSLSSIRRWANEDWRLRKQEKNEIICTNSYLTNYWDFLDKDEKSLLEDMSTDEENLLIEQIKLYTIRERNLIKTIRNEKEKAKNFMAITSIATKKDILNFKNEQEKLSYEQLVFKKQQDEEKLINFGEKYEEKTNMENVFKVVQSLESELTRVQRAKTATIVALQRCRENTQDENNSVVDDWVDSFGDNDE